MRKLATATMTVLLLAALAMPAAAHVTANPDRADAAFFKTDFRVGHGCDGSPVTALRIQIPEEVDSVRPQPVAGWDIELTRAEPDTGEGDDTDAGDTADEDDTDDTDADGDDADGDEEGRVTEVAWTGGSLPDEHVQEFGLSIHITDDAPEVLWFPTIQECEEGEIGWVTIPDSLAEWHDLDEPAPYIEPAFLHDDAESDDSATDASSDGDAGDDAATGDAGDDVAGDGEQAAATSDGAGVTGWVLAALAAGIGGLVLGGSSLAVALRR